MKHRGWILISGWIWVMMGAFLLYKGVYFISEAVHSVDSYFSRWSFLGSPKQVGTFWLGLGLLIGYLKGRFVLAKSALRVVSHILSLALPIRVHQVYRLSYWLLIGSMMLLGMALRFVPLEVRGLIDVGVGSALVQGAMHYFQAARRWAHL